MVRLKHPVSGVVVTVSPELADRLGWPKASTRKDSEQEKKQDSEQEKKQGA